MAIEYYRAESHKKVFITFSFEHEAEFKKLVQRGINLWPDASPVLKEFSDMVTNGEILQDYRKQAGLPSIIEPTHNYVPTGYVPRT